ncbi:MAG: hypothetical protein HKN68_22805 [Saprospiraceae bacterium]|nr:hypothetical protein [Saprospiraceae bacterium]
MLRLHILLTAGFIILLHNMMPHYHIENSFGETETTFYVDNETLKNVLEFIFNTDIGDGHLENIQVEDNHINKEIDLPDSNSISCNIPLQHNVNSLVLNNQNPPVYNQLDFSEEKFNNGHVERGPPL